MTYSFHGYDLDEERFELRHRGEAVRVEPRVLEVLVYLIRNSGRIVTKAELLEQVWKKNAVSDSALTRCIMEARRAIGDSDRSEPLIRTVHGRGYRFEESVEESPSTGAPAPSGTPALLLADIAKKSPARVPALHWIVASAVILLAVAVFALKWPATNSAAGVLMSPARVAILPFTDSNEDRELGLVVLSISDLLEQRLAQVPRIHVRGPDYSRDLSVTSASLAEFATRAGVDHVVSGNVHRTADGKKAHFVLTLHQLLKGREVRETPLGRFDVPFMRSSGELAEYTSVRDAMVRQIVATLSPALNKNAPGNNALVPHESDAYRLYLLGRSRLAGGVCDGGAIELLERSLEIDRRFAPAWEAYGWALYGVSSSCGRGHDGYRKAIEAADRCLALAPDMPSAVGLKATVLVETGRVEEAYRILKDVERRAPQSAEVQSFLFYVLDYAGYLGQAKTHLERLMTMDPHFLTQRGWTPNTYLYLGDTDRFLRTLAGSDTPLFRYYRGLAKLTAGQKKEAHATVAPAFRLNPSDAFARLSEAMAAILEDKPRDAREIIRHIVREREAVEATDGEMTYKVAQLFALSGDHLAALEQLEKAVDQGFFCASCFDRDPFLAAARNAPPYARIAAKARERHTAFGRKFGLAAETPLPRS